MIDHRTWDEMRRDNIGAKWIDTDGHFCKRYTRTSTPNINVPEWQKPGFNGCWSCDNCVDCHFSHAEQIGQRANT